MTIYVKAERLQAKWQRKEGKGRDHLGSNECALLRMVCLGERALEAGNFHCAQTIAIHYELDNMVFLNYRCCDCACSRRDAENTYKRETIHNFIEIGWVFFYRIAWQHTYRHTMNKIQSKNSAYATS